MIRGTRKRVASFFLFNIMASIQEHYNKVKPLLDEAYITTQLFNYIRSIEKELVLLNKNQIELDSEDIFGKPIGFYSAKTEAITKGKKKTGQPFTGKDTGNWLAEFRLVPVPDGFQFWSSDEKTATILSSPDWLSHNLFGLTDENLNLSIKKYFLQFFINYFRNALL